MFMKNLFTLLLFIFFISIINFALCQKLVPTETKALMEISVTDFSKKPLPNETLVFIGDKTKKEITATTGNDGKTKILLPEGETYNVKYRDFTEQVNYSKVEIPSKLGAFTFQLNIKFEPEKVFTLKDVHFDTSKATITPSSFPSLNELVGVLKVKPTMTIEIAGHTDNVGTPEANQKLSQDRANSVKQYLISKGIAANRLTAKGYGDTQPVADNDSEEGRKQNRRTEVRIITN
jgi:OmpA-OmpF porin, OOP family